MTLDLAALVGAIGRPDAAAAAAARERQGRLTKPTGALGRLEELSVWMSAVQGRCPPLAPQRPRVVVFAADHGVAAAGVSAYPAEVTAQMVANFVAGGAAVNVLARQMGAGVRVVDVGVASELPGIPSEVTRHRVRRGSGRIDLEDALTQAETEQAVAVGVAMADAEVDSGADLLVPGDMGIARTTPCAVLVAVLTHSDPATVVGRGTGVDGAALARKKAVVASASARGAATPTTRSGCWPPWAVPTSQPPRDSCSARRPDVRRSCSTASCRRPRRSSPRRSHRKPLHGGLPAIAPPNRHSARRWSDSNCDRFSTSVCDSAKAPVHCSLSRCSPQRLQHWVRWQPSTRRASPTARMAEPLRRPDGRSAVRAGLRLAVTTFTIAPLRPGRVDRRTAGIAMAGAPLIGLALAIVVASTVYGARQLWGLYGISGGISAIIAVGVLAVLTGGLHLDGLADTADGLGATATRERRLDLMRAPDIGAFGAAALAIVVVAQVVALTTTVNTGLGTVSLLTAVTTARLAVTWACVRGVPAARPDGLGALVAGTVTRTTAVIVTLATAVVLSLAAIGHDHGGWSEVGRVCWSMGAGLGAGWLLRLVAVRRLGGITGDVLGATVEIVTAAVLLAVAIRAPNLR